MVIQGKSTRKSKPRGKFTIAAGKKCYEGNEEHARWSPAEGPLERVPGAPTGGSRSNQSYPELRGRTAGREEGEAETWKRERDGKQEERETASKRLE